MSNINNFACSKKLQFGVRSIIRHFDDEQSTGSFSKQCDLYAESAIVPKYQQSPRQPKKNAVTNIATAF